VPRKSPPQPPLCICVAGPNGSGKSTLARALRKQYRLPKNWIDPDAITQERLEDGLSQDEAEREAFREARNKRVGFAISRKTFGFETVFSHPSNVAFLKALKLIGYEVHLYYVYTDDAAINLSRVANRVAMGGHNVPSEKILARWTRSGHMMQAALATPDRMFFLNNSRAITSRHGELQAGRLVAAITNSMDGGPQLTVRLPIDGFLLDHLYSLMLLGRPVDNGDPELQCERTTALDTEEHRRVFLERFIL
jgi:predicted ABC-type ATPase